jgi:hypothetical protein
VATGEVGGLFLAAAVCECKYLGRTKGKPFHPLLTTIVPASATAALGILVVRRELAFLLKEWSLVSLPTVGTQVESSEKRCVP